MFIYKLAAEADSNSMVILESTGDVGLYNRGNRTLYHFLENSAPMLLGLVLNSFVYPFPTFVIMILYVMARMVYTIGYTVGGFGSHVPGFVLERLTFATTMGTFFKIAISTNSV